MSFDDYTRMWSVVLSYYEKFADGSIKCIDDEIPFDIPNGWCFERMHNLFIVNPKNSIPDKTEISFIPMTLLDTQYTGLYDFEPRKWRDCKKGFTHFAEGDFAFAKISPCFENRKSTYFSNLSNGYGAGTTELYILRTYNNELNPKYVLDILKSEYFINRGKDTFSGVVGQQRVNKKIIFNTLFPIPPICEQKDIVQKVKIIMNNLEEIDAALT